MALTPSLADRLRAVVGGSAVPRVHPDAGGPARPNDVPSVDGARPTPWRERVERAAATLGGVVERHADGPCIVVDRRYDADARYGQGRIGDLVATLRHAAEGLALLRRAWPGPRVTTDTDADRAVEGLCVLDLETTGLAGGAGTQAFLVGCARIDGDGLQLRQFLAPGFEHERAQLACLRDWMQDRTHLLTFNGRSFDVPLLEMRFAFQRVTWPWANIPHVDALHPARRFWRDRPELVGPDVDDARCTLGVLERRLAGVHRVGDVPGFEIPARFFQFARDGRAEPLEAVLEHNRLDLVSTLLVCARASALVVGGPSIAVHGHECLGLGRVYERLDDRAGAETCYARAAAHALGVGDASLRAEALRRLASVQRRDGRAAEAAASWRALLATRGVSLRLRREAREALAIHQEHRTGDLASARALVLDALAEPADPSQRARTEHRLARLDRKLSRQTAGGLIAQLDAES